MSYMVTVTRENDQWIADVPGMPGAHTWAGNLPALDSAIREVIALVEDLPDGAESSLELTWDYSGLSPTVRAAASLGAERTEAEAQTRALAARTNEHIVALVAERYSVRDIGRLLGISPGRVSQLSPSTTARRVRTTRTPERREADGAGAQSAHN